MGIRARIRRRFNDRGANLVEFALLAPLLILLVLGIVEFGWKFGQYNDVKHAAREGARFAAVNAGDETAVKDHVCAAMDAFAGGTTAVAIELTDGSSGKIGDTGMIKVSATVTSLTSAPIITNFLPNTLASDVQFRLEQDSILWDTDLNLSC